jgi:DNA-binding winged helix-turn-helix (wHTH) protein
VEYLRHLLTGELYGFGPYSLDVEERRLCHAGVVVPLAPKAFDVLVALVRRAGTLVTKRGLLDLVWREVSVEEGVLAVYVSALRKSLGESVEGAAYIESVPRAGYRFWSGVTHRKAPVERLSMKWPIGVLSAGAEVSELIGRAVPAS